MKLTHALPSAWCGSMPPVRAVVPAAGLFGTQTRLELPALEGGFGRVDRVELV